MRKARKYVKSKPHVALTIPALLCFVQFITDFIQVIKSGNFDNEVMKKMLSSADGFEAVFLVILALVLKGKKK